MGLEIQKQREKREKRKRKIDRDESSSDSEDDTSEKSKAKAPKTNEVAKDQNGVESETITVKDEEEKPKIDIWEKRTVGEVFESALTRFWERKAERESRQN